MSGRILIVDDDQSMCEMIQEDLEPRGFACAWKTSPQEAFAASKEVQFDVIVTDLKMPGMDGIELCTRLVANRPDIPVVVITAFGSLDTAVAAIRAGAYDFVTKPFEMDHLALIIERAIRHHALQEEVRVLTEAVDRSRQFDDLLGESPAMQTLFDQLAQVADSEASVLVIGETGTGKDLVARALHRKSRRRDGPFVAINCAAIPETLLESALFGHVKGAFTGARDEQEGLFRQATGGTLFLDEIGDCPLSLQPKLLRALEERKVRPVGGSREIEFDVRLITATHRDLETEVAEDRFREDLFYRVNVIQLSIPPLRSRGTDVLVLAQHFVERFAARSGKATSGLSPAVAERLLAYRWSGNVRELRNAMERAVALTRYDQLTVEDLPERIRDYRSTDVVFAGNDPAELLPLSAVEREYVLRVMDALEGNRTLAAKVLEIDRKTLYRKLKSIGYDDSDK